MTEAATRPEVHCLVDLDRRRYMVGSEPMLFHCHHYNTYLQRSIEDAQFVDSPRFLVGAAAEVAWHQLKDYFQAHGLRGVPERAEAAGEIFRWAGFGLLDLAGVSRDGGAVRTESSHYSMSWEEKFGLSPRPVCHFMAGYIAGALAAIHDQELGAYAVSETRCRACGAEVDSFVVERGERNYSVFKPVGIGCVGAHRPVAPPASNVDYDGILRAVTAMELVGDSRGLIPAFGVYLTRMYANYYNRISFEFLHETERKGGTDGTELARELLVEAGHVCAFNTFGGIMTSTEWDALVRPSLRGKLDWVHGIVAVVNALGWGRWHVASLSGEEAEFVIDDDYESSGYLAMYGMARRSVSYLAEGAAAGIMNLVFVGDVESGPNFDEEYYQTLFKSAGSFRTDVVAAKAAGDDVTRIRVYS